MTEETLAWAVRWTFVHVLWIGAAIGLLAFVLRWGARQGSPQLRHALGLWTFALLAAAPVAVFAWLWSAAAAAAANPAVGLPAIAASTGAALLESSSPGTGAVAPTRWDGFAALLAGLCDVLPGLWLAGAGTMAIALLVGVWRVGQLTRAARAPGPAVEVASAAAAASLGLRRAPRVAVSAAIASPVTAGFARPVVILPDAARAWRRDRLEMVLLHELAHVQRRDGLANFALRAMECVVFFHPVTRWLLRWVHLEREQCCDQIVVAHTGRPRAYVRTLLAMAELPGSRRTPLLARAPVLSMSGSPLVDRVRNLLEPRKAPVIVPASVSVATLGVCALSGLFLGTQPQAVPVADRTAEVASAGFASPGVGGVGVPSVAPHADGYRGSCTDCHKVSHMPAAPHTPAAPHGFGGRCTDCHKVGQSPANVYVVKAGDSLASIAKGTLGSIRFVDRIRELNDIEPRRLRVGQKLVLPPRAKQPSEDRSSQPLSPGDRTETVAERLRRLEDTVRTLQAELKRLRATQRRSG